MFVPRRSPRRRSGTTRHLRGFRRSPAAAADALKMLAVGRSWRRGSAMSAATSSSAKPRTRPVGERTRPSSRWYGSSTMTNTMPESGHPCATPALICREIGVDPRRRIVAVVGRHRRCRYRFAPQGGAVQSMPRRMLAWLALSKA